MNWRRGFFRVWLFLSALWLVAGLAITDAAGLLGPATRAIDVPAEAVTLADKGSGSWEASFEGYSLKIDVTGNLVDGSTDWVEIRAGTALEISKRIALENAATRLRNAENLRTFLFLSVIPFAALLLGAALGWVAQGFKKPRA